jgi:osmoprotectant transport system permease protein
MNFLQGVVLHLHRRQLGRSGRARARILEHLQYTVIAVVFSVIAAPLGMLIGHTGRGAFSSSPGSGCARCPPWVCCCSVCCCGGPADPPTVALMLAASRRCWQAALASPPWTGGGRRRPIGGHDREQDPAAVETPALPLILGGLGTATLQIVATATVAAYASLGGLGRYLIDGSRFVSSTSHWSVR